MKLRIIYKYLRFVVSIAFLLSSAVAHSDVGLSGSAYSETSLINHDGDFRYGNRSDLHLKAVGRSEGAKLVAELDFYTLYGYLSYLTEDEDRSDARDGQFYVDRLYLKFPVLSLDVILGKQRIAWGSGVIFRPTDNFNRPNPLSLSGRKEGVNALLAKLFVGDLSALDFAISPGDVLQSDDDEIKPEYLKYSKFASRFTFNKFNTDVALSYQYDGAAQNHIYGLDMKGDAVLGYHLETVFVNSRDESVENMESYWRSVLGLDYSFQGKWFLLGEYLFNGSGKAEESELEESSFSLLEGFEYKHYLYYQVSYQYDILLRANAFILWNMVDKSLILSPGISYSLFQNTNLDVTCQIFLGDDTDEYGPARIGGDQIYYLRLTTRF